MTRLLTLMFFSAFMMATVNGHTAGWDREHQWKAHQSGQGRRLVRDLARMDARGRAAEIELDRRALELEERRVALAERQYRDAREEKARARQKEQEKEQAARRQEEREELYERVRPFLLSWNKEDRENPKSDLLDLFIKNALAESRAAKTARKLPSDDLLQKLLDRMTKTDEAMEVTRNDLEKGVHKDDPGYEEILRLRLARGYSGFDWKYVTSLLEIEKRKADRRKYGVAIW